MHPFLEYTRSKSQDMLQLLQQLVEIESPSTDKSATDAIGKFVATLFEGLGAEIEFYPQEVFGNHLKASLGRGDDQILVLCHMDTVWEVGELARRPFKVLEGIAHGPGVYDMKAGIVHAYFAIKALLDLNVRLDKRIVFLFNTDEEMGSVSSRPFIEEEAKKSKYTLVLEPSVPPYGALKTFRKGGGRFELRVTGKASHAGSAPERGVSAIAELAHQIVRLQAMTDFDIGTTVNVGVIGGGSRPNVVAADAWANIDVRVTTMAEAERITAQIKALEAVNPLTKIEISGRLNRPPMERSAAIVEAYEKARALAAELGFELREAGTGGGSDGNLAAAVGSTVLDGLGAVGDGAHSVTEHVVLEHMPLRTALVARLFETL